MGDPRLEKLGIGLTVLANRFKGGIPPQPIVGDQRYDSADLFRGQQFSENGIDGIELHCPGEQDMVFYPAEGPDRSLFPILPGMMKIEGGAMIDQPELMIPQQHIGISGTAVHIVQQTVQPNDLRGQKGGYLCHDRVESRGSGKIMQAQVESDAGLEEVLDLFVGFGAAKGFFQVGKNDLGHPKSQGPGKFSSDQFGDERPDTLSRAAELEY